MTSLYVAISHMNPEEIIDIAAMVKQKIRPFDPASTFRGAMALEMPKLQGQYHSPPLAEFAMHGLKMRMCARDSGSGTKTEADYCFAMGNYCRDSCEGRFCIDVQNVKPYALVYLCTIYDHARCRPYRSPAVKIVLG